MAEKDLRSKNWAGDSDESGIDLRFSIRGADDGAGGQKRDRRAGGDVAVAGRGYEFGESLVCRVNCHGFRGSVLQNLDLPLLEESDCLTGKTR